MGPGAVNDAYINFYFDPRPRFPGRRLSDDGRAPPCWAGPAGLLRPRQED